MTNRLLWCAAGCLSLVASASGGVDDVAHSNPEAAGEPTAGERPAARLETNGELERLVSLGDFGDSLPLAQRFVELTKQEFGSASRETAEALDGLAYVQRSSGRHDDAAASYLAMIDVLRTVDGALTPLVIAPLIDLGEIYQASGEHIAALAAFEEARSVSRRIYGLYDEGQIQLLDRMTTSLVSERLFVEARDLQREAWALVERKFEPHTNAALDARYKYASWLGRFGQRQAEREQYFTAVRIIRDYDGDDSVRLVAPLRAIGNSYRQDQLPDGNGSRALHNALKVLDAQEQPDALVVAEVLRDIGDWTAAFRGPSSRNESYRRAWEMLEDVTEGDVLRTRWFTGLNYIARAPIASAGVSTEPDAPAGYVLVELAVDASGRARDVVVVDAVPPGFRDEAVLKHIKRSLFRPQVIDGELALERRIMARFDFHYAVTP